MRVDRYLDWFEDYVPSFVYADDGNPDTDTEDTDTQDTDTQDTDTDPVIDTGEVVGGLPARPDASFEAGGGCSVAPVRRGANSAWVLLGLVGLLRRRS
jgi:MYXO-CTERM domain-containing protein